MDANVISVLSIFEKKLHLEVPLFQRQYVWNEGEALGTSVGGHIS